MTPQILMRVRATGVWYGKAPFLSNKGRLSGAAASRAAEDFVSPLRVVGPGGGAGPREQSEQLGHVHVADEGFPPIGASGGDENMAPTPWHPAYDDRAGIDHWRAIR